MPTIAAEMNNVVEDSILPSEDEDYENDDLDSSSISPIPTSARAEEIPPVKSPSRDKTKDGGSSSGDEKILEVDTIIQQKFIVKDRLGKGAYGIVWKAEDTRTGEEVALKKIYDAFRNNTDSQRTYREIIFLREFGCHPNIINLLDVHRASNNLDVYLLFPLMDTDLHNFIRKSPGKATPTKYRQIMYQILKAVKFLHSAEVIHRDLKPANILLDRGFNVKLADFGLARSIYYEPRRNNDQGQGDYEQNMEWGKDLTDYVATRWYRPPEILLSCNRYSKAMDMWSLGCILGEMIRRKAVFPGSNQVEQIELVLSTIEPPSLEEIEYLCLRSTSRALLESCTKSRYRTLRNLFVHCDLDAFRLIENLLVFDPRKRLTVEQMLRSRFFHGLRKESEEYVAARPVLPPIDDFVQLPLGEYRKEIYELIRQKKYRPTTAKLKPSLIPISKSAAWNPNAGILKGKQVSVFTVAGSGKNNRNQGKRGDEPDNNGGNGNMILKTKTSKPLRNNNGKVRTVNPNQIEKKDRQPNVVKQIPSFHGILEGEKTNLNPTVVRGESKTMKPMQNGGGECGKDKEYKPTVCWPPLDKYEPLDPLVKDQEPQGSPKWQKPFVLGAMQRPYHTVIAAAARAVKDIDPSPRNNYDSGDSSPYPDSLDEWDTNASKTIPQDGTLIFPSGKFIQETLPPPKRETPMPKLTVKRAVTSIPREFSGSQYIPPPGKNKISNGGSEFDIQSHLPAPSRSDECIAFSLAKLHLQPSVEHIMMEAKRQERVSPQRQPQLRVKPQPGKVLPSYSNNLNVGNKAQIRKDLTQATIKQSWPIENKNLMANTHNTIAAARAKPNLHEYPAAPRPKTPLGKSSYFPNAFSPGYRHTVNTNTKEGLRKHLPPTNTIQRKPHDYAKAHGTINASDLNELMNFRR